MQSQHAFMPNASYLNIRCEPQMLFSWAQRWSRRTAIRNLWNSSHSTKGLLKRLGARVFPSSAPD